MSLVLGTVLAGRQEQRDLGRNSLGGGSVWGTLPEEGDAVGLGMLGAAAGAAVITRARAQTSCGDALHEAILIVWRFTGRGNGAEQPLRAAAPAPAHQNFDSAGYACRDEAVSRRPHARMAPLVELRDSSNNNRKRIS